MIFNQAVRPSDLGLCLRGVAQVLAVREVPQVSFVTVWHAARALGRALRKLTAQEREQWQDLITLLWESLKALPPRPHPCAGRWSTS